ncbi:CDP-glycerol glycerophosphotransferase family protein, partial [uncultured Methanobrevibacter sp.]|uniref:CDP-glycerol glycerophosphotransferase family protein n=1 Tax=uncultured Methanobrevibacter sp. TaxID=253161 RepID=UPI00262C0C0F
MIFSDMIASHDSELIRKACDSLANQKLDFKDLKAILNNEKIKDVLNKSEIETLKDSLSESLKDIDDDLILSQKGDDFKLKCFLLKYGEIPENIILKFNLNSIFIDIYEIIGNKLYVLANISNRDGRKIDVYVNEKKIPAKEIHFPQRDKYCLDYKFATDYSLDFNVALNQKDNFEIEFRCGDDILEIDFSRPCNFSKIAGYSKTKHYLSILKGNKITVEKKTTLKWVKQESKTLLNMLKKREPGLKVGVPFRIAYMLGYPFLKNKRIWFFMDRPDASDDNGMHLFKYAADKDPDIKKYYIIDKNTPDYNEMKKIGNVLGFKSLKHRYLGLFAENIITTHPDNQII